MARAYAACRAIARREAKNFYYAFVALPAARRNAICAIYAFMRQADDLADDEACRAKSAAAAGCVAGRLARRLQQAPRLPIRFFLPCAMQPQRFAIPLKLLDELVAGVTMDLDRAQTGAPDTYATFADLYRYCYLVASVVGLVCIRIFGYSGPRAEKLAEETGIAFQLTNILRDVSRGRGAQSRLSAARRSRRPRSFARRVAASRALRAAHGGRARLAGFRGSPCRGVLPLGG